MSPPLVTRVLLADDHALVRRGLAMILDAQPDFGVVAEAADGVEAVARAVHDDVDLAVLDIKMPRKTGLHAARELSARRPALRLLMLSMHDDPEYWFQAVRAGAAGYVLKSAVDRDLVEACRAAMRGETFSPPASSSKLVRTAVERAQGGAPTWHPLTPREEEVVKLIAEGHSAREIADLLVISPRTVDRHRENALEKLGVKDRVGLTRYAIRHGLVEP
jgi:DNA-binding NarL/FixJ family response regulator